MDRVYTQQQLRITEVEHAAIAIKSVTPKQRHIGVLHRDDSAAGVSLLHLAWHHDLRNHPPGDDYVWIDPPIPAPRLRQVAARCRQLLRANPDGIPYAFSPPNDCFDERTAAFLFGPTRHGLTCATFVLAVFESVGLKLADHETWPRDRAGDREWQEFVIEQLQLNNPPASVEHIQAVRDEAGSVRVRPEEVAGAATVSPLPAGFEIAVERAALVLECLRSL